LFFINIWFLLRNFQTVEFMTAAETLFSLAFQPLFSPF
jgi:hypothetical protein